MSFHIFMGLPGDIVHLLERTSFCFFEPNSPMHGTRWKVEAYFQTLDVDVTEGAALFNMLDDGDGQVGFAARAWVCYHCYHVRILTFGRPSDCLMYE